MGFDIRLPIGMLFTILGLLLCAYGASTGAVFYERSLGININLWWGLILLIFGILMILLARRGRRQRASTTDR